MEEDYQYHGFKGSGELPCSEETKKMLARVSSDDHRIHVCDLCNKEFSSGKALSGHRRIHSHQPSDHPNKKIKNQVHASSSSSSSSVEGLNLATANTNALVVPRNSRPSSPCPDT
jgi:hypothetical protein